MSAGPTEKQGHAMDMSGEAFFCLDFIRLGNLVVPEYSLHSLTSFIGLAKNLSLFSVNYIFINKLVVARPEAEASAQVVVANSSFKPGKEIASALPSAALRLFLAMTFLA